MTASAARSQILEALRGGMSQNAAARQFGCSPSTVNRIARAAGLTYSAPEKANAARRDYAQAERLELLNEGFDKARELLARIATPQQLQQWSVAAGVLIDKRRLEDGEATTRAEVSNGDDVRARLARRLDELAERRAAKTAA